MKIAATTLFAIVFYLTNAAAHDHATATYLGNEGVMIARGDTKIVFDAFYADSYGQYQLVPDDIANAMLEGVPPYDGVDAIFVSHVHGDHFTAAPAIEYLRMQTGVRLYAPRQALTAFAQAGVDADDPIMSRIMTYDLQPNDEALQLDLEGINVDVVAIPHAGNRPDVQNFSWRVTLDDQTTVMHLGDAGAVVPDFSRHMAHFKSKKTHAAFPPYWFFDGDTGETILHDIIGADHIIGVHVPARAAGHGAEWREQLGNDLFTDPGETREVGEKPDGP